MKLAWSNLARAELHGLRRFSEQRWGREITLRYLAEIRTAAKALCAEPHLARPLKAPFHILRVRSHYLIVHIDPDAARLTIARILHVAMDIDRHIP